VCGGSQGIILVFACSGPGERVIRRAVVLVELTPADTVTFAGDEGLIAAIYYIISSLNRQ
jgi:hypothetical protein